MEDTPSAQTWHPRVRFCGRLARLVCVCVCQHARELHHHKAVPCCGSVAEIRTAQPVQMETEGFWWGQGVPVRYRDRKVCFCGNIFVKKGNFAELWVILSGFAHSFLSVFARICAGGHFCFYYFSVPLCKRFCPLRICDVELREAKHCPAQCCHLEVADESPLGASEITVWK